jgi:hypothetical protein
MDEWEGKRPGGVWVLLANPRWERRFVKFLELSGVGEVMADGTDEDGARAAKMDEWVVWEAEEGIAPPAKAKLFFPFSSYFIYLCKGVLLPPRLAHSALWRSEDPFCCS